MTTHAPAPIESPALSPATDPLILRRMTDASQVLPDEHEAVRRLTTYFNRLPHVGVVAAKRTTNEKIFSMGERLIHPKGFHHLGQGHPAEAFRFPEEVDGVNGGFIAVSRQAAEAVGGVTDDLGALSTIDLCLRLRGAGYRCLVVPDVVVDGEHERLRPAAEDAQAFRRRWGFRWRCPDLDVVRERYAGTGLLWDARYWGACMPFEKYTYRPAMHWTAYDEAPPYRERADYLASLVAKLTPVGGRALDIGCGDGLFTHLVAQLGRNATGIDPEQAAIEQARNMTDSRTYADATLTFDVGSGTNLPFPDDTWDVAFMFDVIEHLPNPISTLTEASRVIRPGGKLIVTTPQAQLGGSSDPVYHVTEFETHELRGLLNAVPGLAVVDTARIGGIYRDLVMVAEKQV